MKFSLSWLKEILITNRSAEEIGAILTSLGLEVDAIHEKGNDAIFEVSLTPNLSFASNILGIAREIAAVTGERVVLPSFELLEGSNKASLKVDVLNKKDCPRYLAVAFSNVLVAPSPTWLVERMESAGLRSVNNVVDLTNYAMLTYGLPLHAFDRDTLQGNQIIVRNAKPGEKIITLDGKEHFPTVETLLICDANHPIAIAGVMGSLETEVTEKTKNIILEAAYFEPTQVRRTAKRMSIHSEASHRFERGMDPNAAPFAIAFASALIEKWTSGKREEVIEVSSQTFLRKTIPLRLSRVNRLLGTELSLNEVEEILKKANAEVKAQQETLHVTFPTYRVDLNEEIDLVEEVARFYGYDNLFEKRKAPLFSSSQIPEPPLYLFERKVRSYLLEEGLQEMLTCDLISPEEGELIPSEELPRRTLVKLLNPSSHDQSVMRPSLLPGLLRAVANNRNHGTLNVAGFEIGRVHFKTKEGYLEPTNGAIILSGKRAPQHWETKAADVDFFDLKGILENLLEGLKIEPIVWQRGSKANFHPKQQAMMLTSGLECGVVGQLHPKTLKKMGIDAPVFFAEFNLDHLLGLGKTEIKMKPLSRFPAVTRDWTVTVPIQMPAEILLSAIGAVSSKFLEEFSLLDLYQSEKLGSDRKNLTFRFVYRDHEATISLKTVEEEHARIIQGVEAKIKREVEK